MVTLDDIKANVKIAKLIDASNAVLAAMGYTEHGLRHVGYVSNTTAEVLSRLGYDDRTVELGAIAGWIHDVGNSINRKNHGLSGASLLYPILLETGMDLEEVSMLLSAVGNHEEESGRPVSEISSALIIADKSDAHRTRVRSGKFNADDIHDKVNYSIKKNHVDIDTHKHIIKYEIIMDHSSSVMEFMQIFLTRMLMCEKAAAFLGCKFELVANGAVINNPND